MNRDFVSREAFEAIAKMIESGEIVPMTPEQCAILNEKCRIWAEQAYALAYETAVKHYAEIAELERLWTIPTP